VLERVRKVQTPVGCEALWWRFLTQFWGGGSLNPATVIVLHTWGCKLGPVPRHTAREVSGALVARHPV